MKSQVEITMVMPESEWRRPPTRSERREMEKILDDFCIYVNMPEFATYRDMQRWAQAKIRAAIVETWENGT